MAQMAKGGIVMDVTNAAEARVAEEAGVSFLVQFKGLCPLSREGLLFSIDQ